MIQSRLFIISIFMLVIFSSSVFSLTSYEITVPISAINQSNSDTHFVIDNWENLPHKDQRAFNESWLDYVNEELEPKGLDWWTFFTDISMKCLSYASSTTNDWFSLKTGKIYKNYTNILNGRQESGTNPRELEQVYFTHYGVERDYDFAWLDDSVTHEEVPYDIKGYSDIMTNPPINSEWVNRDDSELWYPTSDFQYTIQEEEYLLGWKVKPILTNKANIKKALQNYGILYAHVENNIGPYLDLKVHSVSLIGYGVYNNTDVFWVHESYTDEYPSETSKYKAIEAKYIKEVLAFYDTSWPTFHHDNRRTGFTLLKGEFEDYDDVEELNIVLHKEVTTDTVPRTSVAYLDTDNNMDIVVGASKSSTDGWLYRLEYVDSWYSSPKMEKRGIYDVGEPITAPPSLANTYGDSDKEVFIGLESGKIMAFDEDIDFKWSYTSDIKPYDGGSVRGELGYTAVEDIDNDGKAEIIFTDSEHIYSWNGTLYILEDDGSTYSVDTKIQFEHGGAWGAPSIANVDSDDYSEIIVPSYYGIYVYDFDGSSLTKKWNNSDGRMDGAVVVYDIDKDNKYELIYTTHDHACAAGANCLKRLYIRDAETGTNEGGSPISLSYFSKVTPALGDIDGDGDAEIIITEVDTVDSDSGYIDCYEYNGARCSGDWPWNDGYFFVPEISPDIVDIDGDGDYEIAIPERYSEFMYILNGTGNMEFWFAMDGELGSAPAIGDIRGKGIADFAVKRAGSPISILTVVTDLNNKPELNTISNITALVGELININESGEVSATDEDEITIYYGSPFNESGLWQTTINDTGDYSILIEASDGNLSDTQYIQLIVFNETVSRLDSFTDDSENKLFDYTQPENKTVQIRLPKNATIIYSEIRIEGMAP